MFCDIFEEKKKKRKEKKEKREKKKETLYSFRFFS